MGVSQTEASLKDANVRKPESLVDIEVDPELNSLFPQFQPCFIELTTPKGNYRHRVDSPKGNLDNPLSQDKIINKFVNLTSGTFNQQQAEAIADKILQIDKAKIIDILAIVRNPGQNPERSQGTRKGQSNLKEISTEIASLSARNDILSC